MTQAYLGPGHQGDAVHMRSMDTYTCACRNTVSLDWSSRVESCEQRAASGWSFDPGCMRQHPGAWLHGCTQVDSALS